MLRQGGSRAKGSRVGDDLACAFEEMARHLRGEIELEAHDLPSGAMTPAQIKAIRSKVASSTKELERLFGIPARTMESYEQAGAASMARCVRCYASSIANQMPLGARSRPSMHGSSSPLEFRRLNASSGVQCGRPKRRQGTASYWLRRSKSGYPAASPSLGSPYCHVD